MNPEVALQILSGIATISGTALSVYFALVFFALRDDDLVVDFVRSRLTRFNFVFVPVLFVINIALSFLTMPNIDTTVPYDFSKLSFHLLFFFTSIILELYVFAIYVWFKYDLCKKRLSTKPKKNKA